MLDGQFEVKLGCGVQCLAANRTVRLDVEPLNYAVGVEGVAMLKDGDGLVFFI